jgi:hypothetical protein
MGRAASSASHRPGPRWRVARLVIRRTCATSPFSEIERQTPPGVSARDALGTRRVLARRKTRNGCRTCAERESRLVGLRLPSRKTSASRRRRRPLRSAPSSPGSSASPIGTKSVDRVPGPITASSGIGKTNAIPAGCGLPDRTTVSSRWKSSSMTTRRRPMFAMENVTASPASTETGELRGKPDRHRLARRRCVARLRKAPDRRRVAASAVLITALDSPPGEFVPARRGHSVVAETPSPQVFRSVWGNARTEANTGDEGAC